MDQGQADKNLLNALNLVPNPKQPTEEKSESTATENQNGECNNKRY